MKKTSVLGRLAGVMFAILAITAVTAAQGPIPISSFEELCKIGQDPGYPLDGHYELTADIDVSASREMNRGLGWIPIGAHRIFDFTHELPACPDAGCFEFATPLYDGGFSGVFDGKGYTIKGLHRYTDYSQTVFPAILLSVEVASTGLFGALNGATVRDLNIEADTMMGGALLTGTTLYSADFVGILAGLSRNSVITNCHVKGTLYGLVGPWSPELNVGGLVGRSIEDAVSNSSSTVTIVTPPKIMQCCGEGYERSLGRAGKVGGLAGVSERSAITGCNSTATIGGHGIFAGGLTGENLGGTITESDAVVTWMEGIDFDNVGDLAGSTAVASIDRVIPQNNNNDDVAVVAPPANTLTAQLAVGPNPVGKSSGKVNFYRQGKRVDDGTLTIYDASGNVINKIRISDNAVPADNTKRQVGSWGLTDDKGKPVPAGTYLVRGVIVVSGKKEKVSILVGVR